ncbi:MAG TPA: hypothetical protein VJR94_12935 [Candidatus Nitrosocosmicus sp.]|nr:hypothetical protein [Candidatus Nitrosocosmicus sp.]
MNKNLGSIPDISEIKSKSQEDRIITYRRFFADLRLSRLYFQLMVLDYFSGKEKPDNKKNFSKDLENFVSYYDKMEVWLDDLAKEGIYSEFQEQCYKEIEAINVIIQSYEGRMKD